MEWSSSAGKVLLSFLPKHLFLSLDQRELLGYKELSSDEPLTLLMSHCRLDVPVSLASCVSMPRLLRASISLLSAGGETSSYGSGDQRVDAFIQQGGSRLGALCPRSPAPG